MAIDDGAHTLVERHAAEVFEPGHAHTFEAAIQWAREELSRFVDGERRARIGSRDRAEREGEVGHGTSKASGGAQRGPAERGFRVRHAANRGPKADDVAECGRIAEGA